MERLRAIWRSGIGGKLLIVVGGLVGLLVVCCAALTALGALIIRPNTVTTGSTPVAQIDTAAPASTAAPALIDAPAPITETVTSVAELTTVPEPTMNPVSKPTPQSTSTPALPRGYVSRNMLGDTWPLTVDAGILACNTSAVTIAVEGTVYAVNGTAKGRGEYADIAAIWADNPTVAGLKKDIGPLIERGLALCR